MNTVDINPAISIIFLNDYGLNAPFEKRLLWWIKNCDSIIRFLKEIHLRYRDIYRAKVNEWIKNIL